MFKEYDPVRIIALRSPERDFDGTEGVARPPRVGDTGIVVAISGRGTDKGYVIESVDPDGMTVWLADFHEDELAPADASIRGRYHIPATPKAPVYLLGALLGSLTAFFVASCWLGLSPAWLALLCAAPAALFGVFMLENIGEAIVMTLFLIVLTTIFITNVAGLTTIKAVVVPLACGLSVGKLTVGIWKEFR